jgi:hypothetical protein
MTEVVFVSPALRYSFWLISSSLWAAQWYHREHYRGGIRRLATDSSAFTSPLEDNTYLMISSIKAGVAISIFIFGHWDL